MKAKIIGSKFWKAFKESVESGDAEKIAELSYFVSKEDKESFIDSFSEDFDEIAVETIVETKNTDLTRISKMGSRSEGDGPFDSLIIPYTVEEVFILKVHYSVEPDEYYYDEEKEIFDDPFNDEPQEENNEFDFIGDEIVQYTKVFTFAQVEGKFKFIGVYVKG